MKERPILFSAPMVRAILEGRKTQTRRVVKPIGNDEGFVIIDYGNGGWPYRSDDGDSTTHTVKRGGKLYLEETPHVCPYGQPGDRLWVREAWRIGAWDDNGALCIDYFDGPRKEWVEIPEAADPQSSMYWRLVEQSSDDAAKIYGNQDRYEWEPGNSPCRWRPSIHMPRWASRINLEIVAVRVERLQDISEADARAEGAPFELGELERLILGAKAKYRSGFVRLWQFINGEQSWHDNPWVWVVEFKRVAP